MELREPIIKFLDVTGVLLHFSQEQIEDLVTAPEHKRFSRIIADTIKHPHEIWKAWEEDELKKGKWHLIRYYLQHLDLTETDSEHSSGAVIVRFIYRTRWELGKVGLILGSTECVMTRVEEFRAGSIEYSNIQH